VQGAVASLDPVERRRWAGERERAVHRALDCLYAIAKRAPVFHVYDGHLLLALALTATTSRSASLRHKARAMGRERARYWMARWPVIRPRLDADSVPQQVIALDAAGRLGLTARRIQQDLGAIVARYSTAALLYFDPTREEVPTNLPVGPYEAWYYALTNAYFCQRLAMSLRARPADVVRRLRRLLPYPAPGTPRHYQAVYAVTHIVYVRNDYGEARLSPRALPRERAFLRASLAPALERREPDTVAEIVESLLALGAAPSDPLIAAGRRFLLATQRSDGGWGDRGDGYGRFHTIWAAIDALRDHVWSDEPEVPPRR
jgi:hypothetical protein